MNSNFTSRQQLCQLINQWNENRLDLFNLSEPDENLEFYGVMRFYYKEPGEKVSTKCIRVSSSATTTQMIDALIEKFHPDIKMLTDQEYSIWEIHENNEERRLSPDEHPLLVQLTWHTEDREGRFLFRSNAASQYLPLSALQFDSTGANLKRNQKRFSKRDKKLKVKEPKDELASDTGHYDEINREIYEEVPYSNQFSRTISNPESVMKKRREKKLQSKLEEIGFNGSNGGGLKIYGEELVPNRPYVTLLVGVTDTAAKIVVETLQKYDLAHENSHDFVLFEITFADPNSVVTRSLTDLKTIGQHQERCLHDQESPLDCLARNMTRGVETLFAIRRRPHGRQLSSTEFPETARHHIVEDPALIALQSNGSQREFLLKPGVNYIGSDTANDGLILRSNLIRPRHCAVVLNEEGVTLTPVDNSDVQLNDRLIRGPARLRDQDVIRLSSAFAFVFSRSLSQLEQKQFSDVEKQREPIYDATQFDAASDAVVSVSRPSTAMTLTGLLELPDHVAEECFLHELVDRLQITDVDFPLTPAFCFYMVCRHRLITHARPAINPNLHDVSNFVNTTVDRICHFVHVNAYNRAVQLFWLANLSEFLHVIKTDSDLNAATGVHLQSKLMRIVSECFKLYVESCKFELQESMIHFLDTSLQNYDAVRGTIGFLNESIRLCRTMKLNASLIIQAFSHLLHFINAYAFNWLISPAGSQHITRAFGHLLRERLHEVFNWSIRHGLEYPAECHLDRITQAVNLLVTPKTMDQFASVAATCYRLNSIQVEYLLKCYRREPTEQPITNDLIQNVVHLARDQADQTLMDEGVLLKLEETAQLDEPLHFPVDGYLIESLRGIPTTLIQFISNLQQRGICRFIPTDGADIYATTNWNSSYGADDYAAVQKPRYAAEISPLSSGRQYPMEGGTPRRVFVQLQRPEGTGFGLSIVAAQAAGDRYLSIYVKKVIEGSPAFLNGNLETGDQLLSVNQRPLINVSQEVAAKRIAESGCIVQFEVAKNAALFNGMDTWLRNTNFIRQTIPNVPIRQQIPPSISATELARHNRSASASELYSQADTMSINSLSLQSQRLPARYRSTHRPQVVQPDRPPSAPKASVVSEPLPQYGSLLTSRSSSSVPFASMSQTSIPPISKSVSKIQPMRPFQPSFSASGRRSAPLFNNNNNVPADSPKTTDGLTGYRRKESEQPNESPIPPISRPTIQQSSYSPSSYQSPNQHYRNQPTLPFLNEMGNRFAESGSLRDRQSNSLSKHQDGFMKQIELLEKTANGLDSALNERNNPSPDERIKKKVQFAAELSADELKENGHTSTSSNASESPRSVDPPQTSTLVRSSTSNENADDEEETEPRTQILGNHEIYNNDPRTRRLNEIQAKTLKAVVDGSNLGFRDKMRMFAEKIGEETPKNRNKISSAQREIEQESATNS
ncbi:Afadin [Aphelenchoides besseyi]|nr:Afadin [Aphelenchoides besseyi]